MPLTHRPWFGTGGTGWGLRTMPDCTLHEIHTQALPPAAVSWCWVVSWCWAFSRCWVCSRCVLLCGPAGVQDGWDPPVWAHCVSRPDAGGQSQLSAVSQEASFRPLICSGCTLLPSRRWESLCLCFLLDAENPFGLQCVAAVQLCNGRSWGQCVSVFACVPADHQCVRHPGDDPAV